MISKIIAIDPGRTTGVVIGAAGTRNNPAELQLLEAFEIHWPHRLVQLDALFANMLEPRPEAEAVAIEAVVIESFHLYGHKAQSQIGNEFPSVRVIGAVEMMCFQWRISERIKFQSASEIARVQIPAGYDQHLHSEHTKDAFKHFRLYCIKQGLVKHVP